MENDSIQSYILNKDSDDAVDIKLNKLLSVIRNHL